MKEINYLTSGTCSKLIHVEMSDDNVIQRVQFIGGCNGNTKGICRLVEGQKAEEVIRRVKGVTCGDRPTSCPDQLAHALEELIASGSH